MSLRRVRSPVAPKITAAHSGTRRSKRSGSWKGFSKGIETTLAWASLRSAGSGIGDQGLGRRNGRLGCEFACGPRGLAGFAPGKCRMETRHGKLKACSTYNYKM